MPADEALIATSPVNVASEDELSGWQPTFSRSAGPKVAETKRKVVLRDRPALRRRSGVRFRLETRGIAQREPEASTMFLDNNSSTNVSMMTGKHPSPLPASPSSASTHSTGDARNPPRRLDRRQNGFIFE
ncbi:hypothetical protein R3P38DRAFT_2802322 [Favolaschia claudopus]|uniref:Uncharacterized protein n=1 Tax=Favolaschia claudopus TaxID=2862362 RepID=A0AAV9ZUH1_9AGAR